MNTGVLFDMDRMSAAEIVDFARKLESLGIDRLWLPELFGREPFALAGHILSNTSQLQVATGIANVYARDAAASKAAAATLAEFSGGRFALGLGVSNVTLNGARGHSWVPPVTKLKEFFANYDKTRLTFRSGEHDVPVYLAAHGPNLMALAREHTQGATTYLMTPEHTLQSRAILGVDRRLHVMMMGLICTDPEEARRLARRALAYYVGLDYYHRVWRELGFSDSDFADGGSDGLIDALVAWGDRDAVLKRMGAHRECGADEVVVIPLNPTGGREPDWNILEVAGAA